MLDSDHAELRKLLGWDISEAGIGLKGSTGGLE